MYAIFVTGGRHFADHVAVSQAFEADWHETGQMPSLVVDPCPASVPAAGRALASRRGNRGAAGERRAQPVGRAGYLRQPRRRAGVADAGADAGGMTNKGVLAL